MTTLERLEQYPGFVYQLRQDFYFLGKWICKPCTETDITDCHVMYDICTSAGETANVALYFHKLRAYSDFALDIPYNQGQVRQNLAELVRALTVQQQKALDHQLDRFVRDYESFCGPLMN